MANKSILEQALLQVSTLEEAVKANAKGILASTMKQELNDLLKEQEDEDPEEEEKDVPAEAGDDETSISGDAEPDNDADDTDPDLEGEPEGEFPQTKEEWVKILASRIPNKKKFEAAKKELDYTWEHFKTLL